MSGGPVSLSSEKAKRSGCMKGWTPRDVLVDVIKRIDAGYEPELLVVISRAADEDGKRFTEYTQCGTDSAMNIGAVEIVKNMMVQNG